MKPNNFLIAILLFLVLQLSPLLFAAEPPRKSRVVVARDDQAVHLFDPDAKRVAALLDRALLALTNAPDRRAAWKQFVQPNDIVGIKISAHGGPLMATRRPLVDAIIAGLRDAGVPADHIIVWDRFAEEMKAANYPLTTTSDSLKGAPDRTSRVRYLATTPHIGADEKISYQSDLVGKPVWGDHDFRRVEASDRSYFSRIITQRVTKIINVPVLTDHRDAGIAGCLFNLAIGSLDNTRRFAAPPWHYDPAIAEICAMDTLREKTVLHILDALLAQYDGGPSIQPRFTWHANTLYLSRDPVALDTLALAELETQRTSRSLLKIGDRARHIASCVELNLGTNDRAQIERIEPRP